MASKPDSAHPFSDTPSITIDGNAAAARVAYLNSEVIALYPITPSSPMGEDADSAASKGMTNLFGGVPAISELQSEAGAAGAIHGALTAGAQAATFTASQGLLLMIPNMYKIAGELTPTVFHVSARALSCQALSIFGDHGDVMAVRGTGFGLCASANPQEVMDLAAICVRTSLKSRVPFVHFFDGFRTSHEIRKLHDLPEEFFRQFIDPRDVYACRERALDPRHADLRGTAENPDLYFQGREAVNPFYDSATNTFETACERFFELTGRRYTAFDYVGPADAEDVLILMGSGADTVECALRILNEEEGRGCGLLKVRLYRPFDPIRLVKALPRSVRRIAVLDRSKEPGSPGEPLYLDVQTAFSQALQHMAGFPSLPEMPVVIGGRFGLGSKEFTPGMVRAIFNHLREMGTPGKRRWTGFTVGIHDDVTGRSLEYKPMDAENADAFRGKFFGLGADGTVGANKNSIKIIGDGTSLYAQGYFVYDSKKAGAITISHLRFSKNPITHTYLIERPSFVAVHNWSFVGRYDILQGMEEGGTLLLNLPCPPEEVFSRMPFEMQQQIIDLKLKVWGLDATAIAEEVGLRGRINIAMQTAFFLVSEVLPRNVFTEAIRKTIQKTYGGKGSDVVDRNVRALYLALDRVVQVPIPEEPVKTEARPAVFEYDKSSPHAEFVENIVLPVLVNTGDNVPVSAMPVNGAVPLCSSELGRPNIAIHLPEWDPSVCIQCNLCSFVCPHSTIRPNLIAEETLADMPIAPDDFKTAPAKGYKTEKPTRFRVQVVPDECTGCGACAEVCPGKERDPQTKKPTGHRALTMRLKERIQPALRRSWDLFKSLPLPDPSMLNLDRFKDVEFLPAHFEFASACAGCGETPYIRLITQLYGDHLYIANATGCSSIYGGTMPVVPYRKNQRGEGVAWQSSLFEDNAEFGLGMRLASDQLGKSALLVLDRARALLQETNQHGELLEALKRIAQPSSLSGADLHEAALRAKALLDRVLKGRPSDHLFPVLSTLRSLSSHLLEKMVWIVGGDGWAYDIGYGGVDHVLANGANVNLLVLDTQVYSNTGGQCSKAPPMGAIAKFAAAGKRAPKK
ncbi:pyruvate:ferredoxin (flavodoxin) oxidoreductase, partial [bacterium]|nr:pyruvate:ferredoxin (flavodoxin) oxidoreductase [bacterium]